MKIQSWLKSLAKKYDPYLTWILVLVTLFSIFWNIYSIQKDISLNKQREEAQERLNNYFQQGDKLRDKSVQKTAEIEKINQEVKQCLEQTKPENNECENLLTKSVALTEEFKNITKEYEQLMGNIDKHYCFLYPDATDRNCEELKKK
ncbi:hypothetical protein H6G06_16330 [Anabaena sphaerica FACHB-251]|uniref:Uncharacterized protein n=1 Tax=Anabaena sphaerica FACHB-251 TaxID=2692883 RepID=A0A926WI44_9NOST|nr:hypothetical protein [Anabaena sphaerica]MBD2295005.1 hypothetical protein [Anabaena sphaerica FACHB-251]